MRNDSSGRRDSRVAILIVAIAAIVGLWEIFRKISSRALGFVVIYGSIYYYYIIITSIILACCIAVIFADTAIFFLIDILRYDINDSRHKIFDKKSDDKFGVLIRDSKISAIVVFITLSLVIPVSYLFEKKSILLAILILLVLAGLMIVAIIQYRHRIRLSLRFRDFDIYKYGIIIVVVLSLILTSYNNKRATIKVEFDVDGMVTINNSCDENFGDLNISIFNMDDEAIYESDINTNDILKAKDIILTYYVNEENNRLAEAEDSSMEMLYWKYGINLGEAGLEDGTYYIKITSNRKSHGVILMNMFTVTDRQQYKFAKDIMEKEY